MYINNICQTGAPPEETFSGWAGCISVILCPKERKASVNNGKLCVDMLLSLG